MPRTAQRPPMPPPGANRTDLLTPGPKGTPPGQGQPNGQPIQLPTGMQNYGESQQLQQAQQAVPLPQVPGPPTGGAGQPGAPAAPGLTMNQAMQEAKNFQPPSLGAFTRPTERPNEPVTAGLPTGPGGQGPSQPGGQLAGMLGALAKASGNSALAQLAQRAAQMGQ